jgi:hypothetical protein
LARIDDFRKALSLASRELSRVNLHRICSLSGTSCVEDKTGGPAIEISFMNEDLLVKVQPEVNVVGKQTGAQLSLAEKIIILHYLLTARGDSMSRNLITFREVPGGGFYYPAFLKRTHDPFLRVFGPHPQRLPVCGRQLGAEPGEIGDVSIRLWPLPRIPITIVLWKGDDEFPPEGNFLFDASIASYLPTEDIVVLTGMIIYRLIRISQSLS